MAHELTQREDGMVEMAFSGPRSAIWHGLGQNVEENQSIEEWRKAAGLDWEVLESPVTYSSVGEEGVENHVFPDRKILFRSDNKEPLGFVGENFNIVQPEQVLEFFRDLVEQHGFKLSTAGSLFGGKRFWALADTGLSDDEHPGPLHFYPRGVQQHDDDCPAGRFEPPDRPRDP